jgi:hypothetical protein
MSAPIPRAPTLPNIHAREIYSKNFTYILACDSDLLALGGRPPISPALLLNAWSQG